MAKVKPALNNWDRTSGVGIRGNAKYSNAVREESHEATKLEIHGRIS
jgi:hypothetical protein